jgi:hypothetical protein
MLSVVLSSIHYPLAMSTYFWRALKRRKDINLTVVGPYTGTWTPWKGGMNVPKKYDIAPDVPLPYPFKSPYDPAIIEKTLGFEPDLWLQVDAGYHANRRPNAKVVAHVATDPHVLNYDLPRSYADKFFCMQTPYMKEGDYWLPYACDPEWHAPITHNRFIDKAGCLIGLQYPNRVKWIEELRRRGYAIQAETGPMGWEYRELNSQALIGMHWSSLKDLAARVFEIMGMGLCPVINRVPDLYPIFEEGRHYLGFSSMEEAIEKFEMAVKDDGLRQRIGRMASDQVMLVHTWNVRIQQILKVCGYE